LEHLVAQGYRDHCWSIVAQQWESRSLTAYPEGIVGTPCCAAVGTEIIGTLLHKSGDLGNCWNALLSNFDIGSQYSSVLSTLLLTVTSDGISITMTYVVRDEHHWNVSVLQRVHLSSFVQYLPGQPPYGDEVYA
jgi:hypothetical protein